MIPPRFRTAMFLGFFGLVAGCGSSAKPPPKAGPYGVPMLNGFPIDPQAPNGPPATEQHLPTAPAPAPSEKAPEPPPPPPAPEKTEPAPPRP